MATALISSLFLLVLSAISSSATNSEFQELVTEKFIRDLNLFPRHEVNIVPAGTVTTSESRRLVEKKITFPILR